MSREECVDVAHQIVEAGYREVVLGGGESLIYPHVRALIEVLREHCEIALFSGGVPGSPARHVETIGLGVKRVVFSLDAPDVATNDRLRGRKGITRALVDLAVAVRREHPTVSVSFNSVVSRHNCDRLFELHDLVSKFRPTGWALTVVGDNYGISPQGDIPTPEQLERFYLETVPEIARRSADSRFDLIALPLPVAFLSARRRPVEWPAIVADAGTRASVRTDIEEFSKGNHNRSFSSSFRCPLIGTDIGISASGWVYPCSGFPTFHEGYSMGDLRVQSLEEILHGEKLKAFEATFPSEACARCWAPSNIAGSTLDRILEDAG